MIRICGAINLPARFSSVCIAIYSFHIASDSFPTIRHCAPYKSVFIISARFLEEIIITSCIMEVKDPYVLTTCKCCNARSIYLFCLYRFISNVILHHPSMRHKLSLEKLPIYLEILMWLTNERLEYVLNELKPLNLCLL